MLLDASARGTMMLKNVEGAIMIIESLAISDHQVQYGRNQPSKR